MSDNVNLIEEDQMATAVRQKLKADDDARHKLMTHGDYTVGWVCALPKEQTAATAMLDETHPDLPKPLNDSNTYTLGRIGKHDVVIACLPKGQIGTNSAATVATQMIRTFSSIRIGLMVGIGGGIPSKVRLGDVVVGTPSGQFSGVVQWDFGKAHEGGTFERTGSLNSTPASLGTALTKLETKHDLEGSKIPEYLDGFKRKWPDYASKHLRSDALIDPFDTVNRSHDTSKRWLAVFSMMWASLLVILRYLSGSQTFPVLNNTTRQVENSPLPAVDREQRRPGEVRVHHGLIASGNQVIKDAILRDKLNKDLGGHVYCVEMEAAGLMNNFPCVVIRGICDYADAQKNKTWQEYAALVAAAFAKELLVNVQTSEVHGERTAKDIIEVTVKVLDELRHEVVSTREKIEKKEELDILKWLTPINHKAQHSDILQKKQSGTCQWFLNSTKFKNWIEKEKGILYCPGIPGAGKTILTAATIEDLTLRYQNNQNVGIAYIYCNFRRTDEQQVEDLLATLLKQLCQQRSSLPDSVRLLQADTLKANRARPTLNELAETLHLVVSMYSRVFIIIDALDECQVKDGCRITFLNEVFKLQTKTRTNLFATSRPSPEIELNFEGCDWCRISASEADIRAYLNGNMWQMLGFVQKRSDLKDDIEEGVATAAQGILYFDSLKDKTSATEIKTLLRKLRERSQSKVNTDEKLDLLAQAYDEAVDRIRMQQPGFQHLATKVLSWVIFARRQLTILELQHALAVSVGDKKLDEDNVRDIKDIVSVCLGLVIVDEQSGIVRLVHYTTQEYFEQTKTRLFPNAEFELATICVAYISFSVFEAGLCETEAEFRDRLESNPPYSYAAQNWGHHARFAATSIPGVEQFLSNRALVKASNQAFPDNILFKYLGHSQILTRKLTAIHFAAYFGLTPEVASLLEDKGEVDSLDDYDRTPLTYASKNGHEATAKFLLEQGAKVDALDMHHETPLSYAVERGHEVIVKLLIEKGADLAGGGSYQMAPLYIATRDGHEAIAKFLIEKGADLECRDQLQMTPLCIAAESGYTAIAKLLIEKGADLECCNQLQMTPLCIATEENHEAIVEMLLIRGAEFKSKSIYGQTLISWAAQHGCGGIFKLLLDKGAKFDCMDDDGGTALTCAARGGQLIITKHLLAIPNINIDWRDKFGRTPLSWAASGGHAAIIKLLLNSGANIESESKYGRTPLTFAAQSGHQDAVELFLETGDVNVYSRDIFGRNPLHWASRGGHDEVIMNLILNGGCDPNSMDIYCSTPISIAARHNHAHLIKQLLDTGRINVTSQDCFGRTPLWYARRYENAEAQQLLLEYIEKNGTLGPQDDSVVKRYEGLRSPGLPRYTTCDICTMGTEIGGVYYHCQICNGDNLDICSDCYQAGGRCLGLGHELIKVGKDYQFQR
ncbi:unnamed protein product [Clonostachys solani]|uniref:Nucleoside phosphorylase domain-containing protein n=1 Tax=Clonostachys solani TaxID=160281 RepID=A0A9P0EFR4_9HYPO|nr:unnamed protein product [Clonostachys solani]